MGKSVDDLRASLAGRGRDDGWSKKLAPWHDVKLMSVEEDEVAVEMKNSASPNDLRAFACREWRDPDSAT